MNHAIDPTTEPPPTGRLLVISPHLDDAVFSCGRLLASAPGATVATVFAGRPPATLPLTDWDRAAGFAVGDDVIGWRREEDLLALETLDARPRWLELTDSQYGSPDPDIVVACLRKAIEAERPGTLLLPLGLFHSDHRLAHDAALALLPEFAACRWLVYEDALYRRIDGLREGGIERLRQQGVMPRPLRFAETPAAALRKAAAVACYRSQLKALSTPGRPGVQDLVADEAYWRIFPVPAEAS